MQGYPFSDRPNVQAGSYLNQVSQQAILSGGMQPQMQQQHQAQMQQQQQQQQQQQYNQFQQQAHVLDRQPVIQTGMSTAAASAIAAVSGVQAQPQTHSYSQVHVQQQPTQIATQQQQHSGSVPQEGDLSALPNAITEWKRIQEEITKDKQKLREKTKHAKTLQEYIIDIMKKNDIDALALRNSGARLTFKRNKRAEGLGPKNLEKFLGEYLKSPDQAQAALKYIQDRRNIKTTEGLQLDRLE